MAILYPKYDKIKDLKVPPTDGEWKLLNFLKDNLDDEFEIFFQPFINGDCPDIILMRKGGGVLIFEVKDWLLNSYHIDNRNRWHVSNNNSIIKSPVSQVLQYKENLYNLHIDSLLELKLRDYKHWYIVNCAVFFYLETSKSVESFLFSGFERSFNELEYEKDSLSPEYYTKRFNGISDAKKRYETFIQKNISIFGKDNLTKNSLLDVLSKTWVSRHSHYFTIDLYENFKRYLKPSFHAVEDGKHTNYTQKQLLLATSKSGEQKIQGVAGSGKTLVLAKRAVNAHIRTNSKVLILTYNISLKNYIHDKISDVREAFHWDNFYISNYHDFFNSQMNNLGLSFDIPEDFSSWPDKAKESFFNNNYYGNISYFDNYNEQIIRYDSILIDEVQDYRTEWLRLIKKFFLNESGEFVVFGDSKQDIYNRVLVLDGRKKLEIPDSPGRWAILNQSFRLSPKITALAQNYQVNFLSKKHNVDEFEASPVQTSIFDYSENILYKCYEAIDYHILIELISNQFKSLNVSPNDACVMSFNIDIIRNLDYNYRQKSHEHTYIMAETKEFYDHLKEQNKGNQEFHKEIEKIRKNKKLHFWMNSGLVKFSTVHSFKGWEIETLFLIIDKESMEESHYEIIYTGFTRCIKNMIFLNIGDIAFDSFIKQQSSVKHIE